jgi:hypothetical protein
MIPVIVAIVAMFAASWLLDRRARTGRDGHPASTRLDPTRHERRPSPSTYHHVQEAVLRRASAIVQTLPYDAEVDRRDNRPTAAQIHAATTEAYRWHSYLDDDAIMVSLVESVRRVNDGWIVGIPA